MRNGWRGSRNLYAFKVVLIFFEHKDSRKKLNVDNKREMEREDLPV